MLWALLSTNKGSSKICRLCLIPKKAPRKEKKNVKENDFFIFGFIIGKCKRKSNIITIG